MKIEYLAPIVLGIVGAALLMVSLSSTSETAAFESKLTAFNARYGTGATKLDSCTTCHNADETLNDYGAALAAKGGANDEALAAVESLDSDGDTFTNVAEITARTWPGDGTDFPGSGPTPTPVPPVALTSVSVPAAPVIDGTVDSLWSGATAVNIPVAAGVNMGSSNVSVKSVYTAGSVYFLLDYADPTESQRRSPWQKQADGSWLKLSTSTTQQENTYYEDKVALAWDIDVTGFAQRGCATLCHAGEQPANSGYGSKYTPNAGEEADLWHWKSVRTDPVNQVDDQYVNGDRYDATTAKEAGRHSDPNTGGGYSNNQNAGKTAPLYTAPHQPAPPYWILDSEKLDFVDTYQTGDEIAGIIAKAFTGDRGDIQGKGAYQSGHWILEIGRPLTTAGEHDVQFDDLNNTYPFGVAVFDNAQVEHAYQNGVALLAFAPAGPALIQGDVDCNGTANSVDALKVLRFVAGLSVAQEPDCPDIGTEVASFFGDVDCSNAVNSVDSLKILRFVAGMSVIQTEPCADIGDTLN